MKKQTHKVLAVILSVTMFFTIMPLGTYTVGAAGNNPYPTSQDVDGDGYTEIPCTRYAWQQAYDNLGVSLPGWGNAINWYDGAGNSGYSVGTTAQANSIAVWSIDTHSYGHVAFVTSVNGSNMVINEGGRTDKDNINGGIVNGEQVPATVGSYYYGRTLIGFIYLSHTHSYERGYEAAHPHKVYMKCSCGDWYYTDETTYLDSCSICHSIPGKPTLNVVATDETSLTGFTWNNVSDADHYDLRVWRKSDDVNVLTVYTIRKTDYSYNLPAGDYYADVCSVAENMAYTGSGRVSFTVKGFVSDFQPTDTVVCGNKIYALFENAVSYDYAKLASEKMGGYLASIHSKEDQDAIYELISDKKACFWLGGNDSKTEGVWKWEDGTLWDYANWAPGEPNNDGTYYGYEDYLEISSYTGLWNDVPYRYNFNFGFIAEFFIDEIARSESNSKIRKEFDSNLKYYFSVSKYILFNKAVPWEVAEAYCESLGGHLATITSSDENATVTSLIENGTYFLGATDKNHEGTWQWITGEKFEYSNWKTGEPNDYAQGEDYASIDSNGWNDMPNIESLGFLCEPDISDFCFLKKFLLGVYSDNIYKLAVCDVNRDGNLDICDVIRWKKILIETIPS